MSAVTATAVPTARETASLLEEHAGLSTTGHDDELVDAVHERLRATGCDGLEAYRRLLARPEQRRAEIAALAARVTVGETYFFRDANQLAALVDAVRDGLGDGAPRILSAGCSSGDEAYSIAIALREALGPAASRATIIGIDLNPRAVEQARRARYSAWALRATPEALQQRYFRREADGRFALSETIRDRVTFVERNVLDADASFWAPGSFDAIVCRNVFIYFGPRGVGIALARFAEALPAGGLLFVGSADAIGHVGGPFEPVRSRDLVYFRRQPRGPEPADARAAWVTRIEAAARRTRALATRHGPPSKEPEASGADAGVAHAATLAARGGFREAERACREVLARDPSSADAHYVIGLCREQTGELLAAVTHHEVAVALDPTFALAHLRLGLIARRTGDRAAARRALETARRHLADEPQRRVTLFGDGFRREALVHLCASALEACRSDHD